MKTKIIIGSLLILLLSFIPAVTVLAQDTAYANILIVITPAEEPAESAAEEESTDSDRYHILAKNDSDSVEEKE